VPQGHEENVQIEPRGPVGDVVEIVLDTFAQRRVAAPAVDLGPAGDAGFDGVPSVIVRDRLGELADENRTLRTRAYQAHVADEDVDELRQLVQARLAQEGAELRCARVV